MIIVKDIIFIKIYGILMEYFNPAENSIVDL